MRSYRLRSKSSPRRRRLRFEAMEARQVMAAYLSEIHYSPLFGTEAEDQYIELRGAPNETLSTGSYLVVIGSADGVYELGDVHSIFDLSGLQFGTNGYLVLMESAGGYSVNSAAKLVKGSDGFLGMPGNIFSADNNAKQIRTGSNTFLLIQSAVRPLLTTDIDANDDGQPEGAYLNWTILDGVTVFPWVENVFTQRGYAPITFRERAVGSAMFGSTIVDTDQLAYVARIDNSTGFRAADWVAGNTVEASSPAGDPPSWKFELQQGIFGTPRPFAYAGLALNHVGSDNWTGNVSGSVFRDDNSNGVKDAGELPIVGTQVSAVRVGDVTPGFDTEIIEPDLFATDTVLTNVSSNFTLTTADNSNKHQSFKVKATVRGGTSNDRVFSSEGIDWFSETGRLRIDFYRPGSSVSINAIGSSDLSDVYGRLEIFNSAGASLGFVRSRALRSNQFERLTLSSAGHDIAYAVAYSENSYLGSSPFGRFDSLSVIVPEISASTDANGNYAFTAFPRGSYTLAVQVPVTYDLVYPVGGSHTIAFDPATSVKNLNFGLLGNRPPKLDDQSLSISENSPAGSIVATLPVVLGYPTQNLKATILSGDSGGLFQVDTTTMQLKLLRPELNFESVSNYSLQVRLEDSSNPDLNDTAILQLTVTDLNEPPRVTARSVSLAENSPAGLLLATMTAEDLDSGAAGQVLWSILAGNTDNAFKIDPLTGDVAINDASRIDFERTPTFNLTVRATDQGVPALFGEAVLSVALTNVNEPPAIEMQPIQVRENTLAGTDVATVSAIDRDRSESLQWSIVGGSGASLFSIAAGTGVVKFIGAAPLDFEQSLNLDLVVKVADSGAPPLSDTRTFVVTTLDENDPPQLQTATFSIDENTSAPGTVGTIAATDQDAGQALTYSISGGDSQLFTIDSSSGVLRIATGTKLDYENSPVYKFIATATDSATPPKSQQATITIQLQNVNEAPVLSSANMSVGENSLAGASVGFLMTQDPDAGEQFEYTLLSQTHDWFTLDASTGELKVAEGAVIDFEAIDESVITARVKDRAGLTSTAAITVNVSDRNDPPRLAKPLTGGSLKANEALSYTIPTDTFTDDDAGDSLQLFVTTASGFPLPGWLTFNAATRVLSGTPTTSDGGTLSLRVTAVDQGGAAAVGNFSIVVDANLRPWHNASRALDVSGDTFVTARDALLVINFLNTTGAGSVPQGSTPIDGWLDTNADNAVSSIDVLLIINDLNLRPAGGESTSGEGESSSGGGEVESAADLWSEDFKRWRATFRGGS